MEADYREPHAKLGVGYGRWCLALRLMHYESYVCLYFCPLSWPHELRHAYLTHDTSYIP